MNTQKVIDFIDKKFCFITTLPAFIVTLVVVAFPTIYGLYTSFFVRNLFRQQHLIQRFKMKNGRIKQSLIKRNATGNMK